MDMVGNVFGIEVYKDYFYIILMELFVNVLEYGILKLDFDLKCIEQGYLDYYQ